MDGKRKWSELTPTQRSLVVMGASVEVVLTSLALIDLAKRPSAGVRGSKLVWAAGCFVQPIGPLAYFVAGRRPL